MSLEQSESKEKKRRRARNLETYRDIVRTRPSLCSSTRAFGSSYEYLSKLVEEEKDPRAGAREPLGHELVVRGEEKEAWPSPPSSPALLGGGGAVCGGGASGACCHDGDCHKSSTCKRAGTGGPNISADDDGRLPVLTEVTLDNIRDHWRLVKSLVQGPPRSSGWDPIPSVIGEQGKAWWAGRIQRYRAWLGAVKTCGSFDFPYPPREIRWCWVAHMLQPASYRADCLDLFDGRVLPHENKLCLHTEDSAAGGPDEEFLSWWSAHVGQPFPSFADAELPTLRCDWWKGIDSEATLFKEVHEVGTDFEHDDEVAKGMVVDYKRYLYALWVFERCEREPCMQSQDKYAELTKTFVARARCYTIYALTHAHRYTTLYAPPHARRNREHVLQTKAETCAEYCLSPGALVDLTWHSHQSRPTNYVADMEKRPHFIDRECFRAF